MLKYFCKYKNILAKCYTPNLSEDVFVIRKVKNTTPWTYVGKKLLELFMKKHCKKQINVNSQMDKKYIV